MKQPVEEPTPAPEPEEFKPPPAVAVTPCDPWPRPYYFQDGFRRVAPYFFTYNTNCKGRWRGRTLFDIFSSEFRDRSKEYYKSAIEKGSVTINGKTATIDTAVQNGDVISHTMHRHEPPVTSLPIGVIHEDEDLIVIDKPAGVPVHPAGRYNFNSIVEIMRAERGGGWNPLPCNRLDRLTSGVMFIGKYPKAAERMAEKLKDRTVHKEYLARVKGRFPDGIVVCDQPVMSVSPMLGLNRARASGKEAKTKFRRLAYVPPEKVHAGKRSPDRPATPPATIGGDTPAENTSTDELTPTTPISEDEGYSIVHCFPLTGRTHQIRVHLQFLGHPITNDPIYCNRRVFGPDLGKADATGEKDAEIIEQLKKMGKTDPVDTNTYQTFQAPPPPSISSDPNVISDMLARQHDKMVNDYLKRKGEKMSGEKCEVCQTELYTDPGPHEMGIFLHAVRYACDAGEWEYSSPMPAWALPPEGVEGPTTMPEWTEEGEDLVTGTGVPGETTALVEGLGAVSLAELVMKADYDANKTTEASAQASA